MTSPTTEIENGLFTITPPPPTTTKRPATVSIRAEFARRGLSLTRIPGRLHDGKVRADGTFGVVHLTDEELLKQLGVNERSWRENQRDRRRARAPRTLSRPAPAAAVQSSRHARAPHRQSARARSPGRDDSGSDGPDPPRSDGEQSAPPSAGR